MCACPMTTQPNLKAITVKYGMLLESWSEVALFGVFSAYMKKPWLPSWRRGINTAAWSRKHSKGSACLSRAGSSPPHPPSSQGSGLGQSLRTKKHACPCKGWSGARSLPTGCSETLLLFPPSTSLKCSHPRGPFPDLTASTRLSLYRFIYGPFYSQQSCPLFITCPSWGIRSSTRGPSLPQDCVPGVLPVLNTAGAHKAREERSRVGLPLRTSWFLTPPSSQRGFFLRDENHLLSGVYKNNPRL